MDSSCYNPSELSELQQRILKHFVECKEKVETISHISRALGKLQPSVQRSVDFLIDQHYLTKTTESYRRKRDVQLTEKGAAAALLLGVSLNELGDYGQKYDKTFRRYWDLFKRIDTNSEKLDRYIRKAMEFCFNNNFFDGGRFRRQLTEEEKTKIRLHQIYIAKEYFESIGFKNNINNLNDFFDKYKIDKDAMRDYLKHRKQEVDWALKELDKD